MRWCFSVLILLVCGCCANSDTAQGQDEEVKVVKTTQGVVRGYKDRDTGVYAFYSIPYATVPAKSHRFKGPLPGPAWIQPLEAVDKGIVCPQPSHPAVKLDSKQIQENCLVASVYVPDTKNKKLPVVVYVHGGAFQIGYGDMIPPIRFVKNKNIIAVTFNYRLGFNGFLCLGTPDVPGNAGLRDQVALLQWVKKNIATFGGNPEDVTIAGVSAGSVSVDLLMLSKTTRGLFNKVIPESGASSGVVAIQQDPVEIAKNYAKHFGFTDDDDIYALEKFYQDAPFDMFTQSAAFVNSTYGFVPCVERDSGSDVILHDTPINIIKSGKYKKLPMLFGFANMEGLFNVPYFGLWKKLMNEKFSEFLPVDMQFETELEKEDVAKKIREFYFGDGEINEKSMLGYINYFTDILFGYCTLHSVKLHVEAGHDKIYLYEYSFVEAGTPVVPHSNVRGAGHGAQTLHILDRKNLIKPTASNSLEEYNNMRDILQDIWYNFITTGKPVAEGSSLPNWPAVGEDRSPHMSLGTSLELRGPLMQERARFWDDLYSKYYRAPEAPPKPPARHTEL